MNKMYPKIQQTILVSIATLIGAQISFNLFRTDFTISIGMMAFPIALVLFGKYRVLPATFLSAAGVFASRILMHWMQSGEVDFYKYVPELVFYLVYGFLFYIYCRKNDYEISVHSTVPLFLADFCSNLIELLTRETTYGFDWRMLLSIFLIAVSRTVIIVAVLVFLNYYKFSLLRREHADRYQRLLILISKLNDEVVFMQKNRKMIEATMSTSYKLFQEMQKEHIDPELSKKALNIAKDVHELKKEYTLILRGLSDAMELNTKEEGMYLHDILRVLERSMKGSIQAGKELALDIQLEEDLYTEKHYFIMSVFRNLLNNAIEASETEVVHISVRQETTPENYLFMVEDDGPGISEENLEQIFVPGFSTKINFETGEVNRGLGLELVKDLIEHQWSGTIGVKSCPGKTVFTICIPKEKWKEDD